MVADRVLAQLDNLSDDDKYEYGQQNQSVDDFDLMYNDNIQEQINDRMSVISSIVRVSDNMSKSSRKYKRAQSMSGDGSEPSSPRIFDIKRSLKKSTQNSKRLKLKTT